MRTIIIYLTLVLSLLTVPLHAQDTDVTSTMTPPTFRVDITEFVPDTRPAVLPSLYVAHVGLHAYDFYSTTTALKHGAVEANPTMSSLTAHTAVFAATKLGAAAFTILATEKLWKRGHKGAAIGLMIASNVGYTMLAAHNARVLRQVGR